jgi:competence protein ComEC
VRVLDVGQGSAVLVRSPQGSTVLIDGGPAQSDLLDDLLHLGVGRLDVVVVSHPHADHFGGLAEVVGRIPVGLFVDQVEEGGATDVLDSRSSATSGGGSATVSEAEAFMAVREAALAAGARHVLAGEDATLTLGDVSLEFDAPEAPLRIRADGNWARAREPSIRAGPALSSEGLNASSVVVIVRLGGLDILIPGDAEATALAGYQLRDVDCVVVPHHGSRGAVTSALLGALSPEVAVISVGADNPFGHPESGTIETIEDAGARIFRTDLSGSVSIAPLAGEESGMSVGVEKVAGGGIGIAARRSRR